MDSRIAVNGFVRNAIDVLQRRAPKSAWPRRQDPMQKAIVGANSQTLSPGSELYANETVRTGNRGQADLVFIDNTNLTVGPTSEVLLDKFVYDPIGSSGRVVLQATRGAFRFVTGKQDHRAYRSKLRMGRWRARHQSYDPDNGTGNVLAYAPTDLSGKTVMRAALPSIAYAHGG